MYTNTLDTRPSRRLAFIDTEYRHLKRHDFQIQNGLLNVLLLSQTLVKRLRDYKLPFIRGAKSDHTGQSAHIRAPLSAWFGNSCLLLRTKLIFTLL